MTHKEYSVKDSFSFADEISKFENVNGLMMASFDIQSLFTNIPLDETINICAYSIYANNGSFFSLSIDKFKKFLQLAVKDVLFIYNDKLFKQTNGVAMGSPLGPFLANIFLCQYETKWLNDCPLEFKPCFYRRYIDDTFLLFKSASHIPKFLHYLNSKHSSIKFTCDVETNSKLNFLDKNYPYSQKSK